MASSPSVTAALPPSASQHLSVGRYIIRSSEVSRICGLKKSARYQLEAQGLFPKRVILSKRASGYFADEIAAWLESRPRAGRAA